MKRPALTLRRADVVDARACSEWLWMARDARDAVAWLREQGVLGPVFAPRLRAEGIDLRGADLRGADLRGALRWSSDPSLSGWTLRDGVLAREVLS